MCVPIFKYMHTEVVFQILKSCIEEEIERPANEYAPLSPSYYHIFETLKPYRRICTSASILLPHFWIKNNEYAPLPPSYYHTFEAITKNMHICIHPTTTLMKQKRRICTSASIILPHFLNNIQEMDLLF